MERCSLDEQVATRLDFNRLTSLFAKTAKHHSRRQI